MIVTDRKLTEVLGYSNVKPDDADLVVQALDENNVPISEELTNKEGEALATEVAVGLSPVNKTRTISLDEALAERKNVLMVKLQSLPFAVWTLMKRHRNKNFNRRVLLKKPIF